jgi:DNA-binding NtrC family response regulator
VSEPTANDTSTLCQESSLTHGGRRQGAGRHKGAGVKTVDMARYQRLRFAAALTGETVETTAKRLGVSIRTLRRRLCEAWVDDLAV